VASIGRAEPVHITEALGVILIRKAFAAGCSAPTGVEAIASEVPARLVNPVVSFVQDRLAEVEPRRRRYQLLHNQRGLILASSLRQRTDAIVAMLPFRL
jgi:hypothetical protein